MEFSGQVNNIFTDESGEITLQIKNNSVTIKIEDNTVQSISENLHLNTEVIYIDDPFIMDEMSYPVFMVDLELIRITENICFLNCWEKKQMVA